MSVLLRGAKQRAWLPLVTAIDTTASDAARGLAPRVDASCCHQTSLLFQMAWSLDVAEPLLVETSEVVPPLKIEEASTSEGSEQELSQE